MAPKYCSWLQEPCVYLKNLYPKIKLTSLLMGYVPMKKLFFLMLLVVSAGLHACSVDDLERAIIQSNAAGVQKCLGEAHISASDQQRLLMLANDIMQQRLGKYECHFLRPNSLLVLFEFSKGKIIAILSGAGLVLTSFATNLFVTIIYSDAHKTNFSHLKELYTIFSCAAAGLLGCSVVVGAVLKHFYDVKKLYDNSIEIKQFICKATISVNG